MWTSYRLHSLALAAIVSGCGGGLTFPDGGSPPVDGLPAALEAFSGNGQEGTVGKTLDNPLVVRLTDANSQPVAGAPVVFQFKAAVPGAEVDREAETNGDGLASAQVRLGEDTGPLEVEARVATAAELSATFLITALDRGKKDKDGKGGDDDDDD